MELTNHSFQVLRRSRPSTDLCSRPYGDFTYVLHEKRFSGIVLANCKADTAFPSMWLRGRSGTLRRLELLNLHLIGYDRDPESGTLIFFFLEKPENDLGFRSSGA